MKFRKGPKIHVDNVDIRNILESMGVHYKERGKNISAGWIGVTCPFCDDNTNHLGINLRSKTISCWKCGKTGTIIAYLSKELNSFQKALDLVKANIPRELQFEKEKEKTGVSEVILPRNSKSGLSVAHKEYLIKRGFDPEFMSEKYMLHHVGPVGEYKNRIIIPVLRNYQLVTFTTIDIYDYSPNRYIHLSEELSIYHVKELLYGSEFTDGHNIIVVEGIFDMWRFGDGCVPAFGVHFTPEQKKLLSKFHNIKVVGDGDKEGWKFNKELTAELAAFSNVRYFDLEEGIDPDKLSEEEIRHIKNC